MAENKTDFSDLIQLVQARNSAKETKQLNKSLESLNKTMLQLAKQTVPALGQGSSVSSIAANRPTYTSFADNLRSKFNGVTSKGFKEKFGNARGLLNTLGVIEKGSGGVLDKLLERREAKQQYIKDQFIVNPQMVNTRENRAIFSKKFDKQQKLQKDLSETQKEIERLESQGYTEKQIKRSGLFKKRDEQAAQLIASDNRLYDMAKQPISRDDKKDRTSAVQEELQNETNKAQQEYIKISEGMAYDIAEIRKLLEQKEEQLGAPVADNKPSWLSAFLGGLGGLLLGKFLSFAGMIGSALGRIVSPILSFLKGGAGKALDVVKNVAVRAGTAIKDGAKVALEKGKGVVRTIGTKAAQYGRVGLQVASRAALPVAAVTTAGVAGYQLGKRVIKPGIDSLVQKASGDENATLGTWIYDKLNPEQPIEKSGKEIEVTKMVEVKKAQLETAKEKVNKTMPPPTIVSAPTTVNNQSTSNNILKLGPRNMEPSFNRYVLNRYSR